MTKFFIQFTLSIFFVANSFAESTVPEVIKVGALLSLSGDYAPYGSEIAKGIELAALHPSTDACKLKFSFQDIGSFSAAGAASASQRALTIDKVDLGVVMGIDETDGIAPIFTKAKRPMLVLWDSVANMSKRGPLVFSNGFATDITGKIMADFANENLKARRIAIVTNNNSWSVTTTHSFEVEARRLGQDIIFNESVDVNISDFRSIIAKIKLLNPDATYIPLAVPANAGAFVKQARELQLKGEILAVESYTGDALKVSGVDAAEGVYLTWIYSDSVPEVLKLYKERYNSEPFDPATTAVGYDGVRKLEEVCERKREKEVTLLQTMKDIFGPEQRVIRSEKVFQIKGGKMVLEK